jgi:hypothetical protein
MVAAPSFWSGLCEMNNLWLFFICLTVWIIIPQV